MRVSQGIPFHNGPRTEYIWPRMAQAEVFLFIAYCVVRMLLLLARPRPIDIVPLGSVIASSQLAMFHEHGRFSNQVRA